MNLNWMSLLKLNRRLAEVQHGIGQQQAIPITHMSVGVLLWLIIIWVTLQRLQVVPIVSTEFATEQSTDRICRMINGFNVVVKKPSL